MVTFIMNSKEGSSMSFFYTMGQGFLLMVPAYAANMAPSIIKGHKPMDFGRNFIDGKRLFGDGKTIRGFFSGILCGIIVGMIFGPLYELVTGGVVLSDFAKYGFLGFLVGFGTVLGDLCGSFIKRRFNVERGAVFPLMDQEGFMIGAIFMLWLVWSPVPITWTLIIALLIITPPLHLLGNIMAYKLGNKKMWY